VRKLELRGVIRGYVALLDPRAVDKATTAFVTVALRAHGADILERVTRAVVALDEVRACWHIAGDIDLLLKVVVSDLAAYETFVRRKLSAIDGIGRIKTSFALAAPKDETRIPLDAAGMDATIHAIASQREARRMK
jgi:DNA-binding Lrp family transcriptional regulator